MTRFMIFVAALLLAPQPLRAAGGVTASDGDAPELVSRRATPSQDLTIPLDAPPTRSPIRVDLAVDLPLTIAGLVGAFTPGFATLPPVSESRVRSLDPGQLSWLDRNVVGNRSAAAGTTSDLLLTSAVVLPHVAGLVEHLTVGGPDGLRGVGRDSLILAETLALNTMICRLVKHGVRRPRPYAYDPNTPLEERLSTEANLSFFSGHTSWAFSMATSYSYLYTLRHRGSPWVPVVWGGTHAAAATTGILRVAAGSHFWSDVLTGAAVGSALGLAVPLLHRRDLFADSDGRWSVYLRNLRVVPTVQGDSVGLVALTFW